MRPLLSSALLITFLATVSPAANDVPDWVRAGLAQKAPSYPSKITFAVLLHEELVSVDADGRRVIRERGMIRIVQPGGKRPAATRTYDSKNGRIRDFQGWLVPPSGKPTFYAKDKIVDAAVVDGVYEETRMKMLVCDAAPVDSVFAWEVTEEEKTVFTQYDYLFQDRSPVLVSRFSLTLPAGWEVRGSLLNHDQVESKTSGNTTTWELRDLPQIDEEDYSPPLSAMAPRLTVGYFPPPENTAGLRGLKDWAGVSAWLADFMDPPAAVTDSIRTKAAQLTSSAATDLDKIRAVASFVQGIKYVEIALNLTRGGGYTPRRADEVLVKNYGDCKDKATLMRALLKAAGIESYLVPVTAGDRTYVRPEWASPMQFNHAIVAIRVSNDVALPTVIDAAGLGRLLIFDPTDSVTPLGDLPNDEQGSYGLVVAGGNGALLKLPALPADAKRVESIVEGAVDANGRLDASIQRQYFGQSAVSVRGIEKFGGSSELKQRFERSYSRRLPGTSLTSIATEANAKDDSLALHLNLADGRFGQIMQGKLYIIRPGVLTSGGDYGFSSKQRSTPIRLESDLRRDTIRIKLPEGFKLDELPGLQKLESPYGTVQAKWTFQNGELVMEETLEIRATIAPASAYPQVRDFFEHVAGVHQAPVVFVKE